MRAGEIVGLAGLAVLYRLAPETGRFEDAATLRDRASAFVRAVERQRRLDALLAARRVEIDIDGESMTIG